MTVSGQSICDDLAGIVWFAKYNAVSVEHIFNLCAELILSLYKFHSVIHKY